MKVVTIHNRKGGTGKSVLTVLTASFLSSAGRRVLVVDLDGQRSATGYYSRIFDLNLERVPTTLEVMEGEVSDDSAIVRVTENLWLIPSSPRLTSIETSAATVALAGYLKPFRKRFDYILIDTAGYWSPLTQAALQASDELIVPVFSSVDDIDKALETLKRAGQYRIPARLVLNQYRDTKHDQAVLEAYRPALEKAIMSSTIPYSPVVRRYMDTGEKMSGAKNKREVVDAVGAFVHEAFGENLQVEGF